MHENEYPLVANSDSFLRELCMKLDHENGASHEKPPTLIKHDVVEMLEDDVDEQKNVTSVLENVNDAMSTLEKQTPTQETPMEDDQTEGSSHNGNELHDGVVDPSADAVEIQIDGLSDEVAALTRNCTFLSHQLNMIMCALRVRPCTCPTCSDRMQQQRQEEHDAVKAFVAQHASTVQQRREAAPHVAVVPQQQHRVQAPQPPVSANNHFQFPPAPTLPQQQQQQRTVEAETPPCDDGKKTEEDACTQLLQQLLNPEALEQFRRMQHAEPSSAGGLPHMMHNGLSASPQRKGGRRSKYCTAEEKKAVAEYAQVHGAAAAGRRFNIPPPVAAYYQRKHSRTQMSAAQQQALLAGIGQMQPPTGASPFPASPMTPQMAGVMQMGMPPQAPPTPATPNLGDDRGTPVYTPTNTEPSTPQPQQSCEMAFKMGLSQSPVFVRGRGRGRPKLIGDELDMHLVEHMVAYKKSDPTHHLTASRALDVARDYIVARAPGLLEEHGGQVKLKITWAMKLVQRVAEREREIEMGLPPGTLQNLGRIVQQMPNGQINPMDVMCAQQQGQGPLHDQQQPSFEQLFASFAAQAQNAAAQNGSDDASCMPEIIKGQEIDIAALLGLCADGELPDSEEKAGNEGEVSASSSATPDSCPETGDLGGEVSGEVAAHTEAQPPNVLLSPTSQAQAQQLSNFIFAS